MFWRNGVGSDLLASLRSLKQYLHMWKPDIALLRVCLPLSSTVRSDAPYVNVAAPHQSTEPKESVREVELLQSVCSYKLRHQRDLMQITAAAREFCHSIPCCKTTLMFSFVIQNQTTFLLFNLGIQTFCSRPFPEVGLSTYPFTY